jgi:hypothetical protein
VALTRGVDPDLLDALASGAFWPVLLVYIDWPDDPVRVHSGVGVLEWDEEDWVGVGDAGFLNLPGEAPGLAAFEGEASVGGVDAEIDAILDADPRWREVSVWFGAVTDRAGVTLIGEPVQVFWGYVDSLGDRTEWTPEGAFRVAVLGLGVGPGQRANDAAHHSYEQQIEAYPGDTSGRWLKAGRTRVEAVARAK